MYYYINLLTTSTRSNFLAKNPLFNLKVLTKIVLFK